MTTDPDPPLAWVLEAAYAAELITALSHPDLAALLAAAPRRPGATVPANDLRERSGLGLKAFAAAVSRGRNAGVLRTEGAGDLAVDQERVAGAVARLVDLTPLGDLVRERPELAQYARYGRITEIPTEQNLRSAMFALVAELIPSDRDLTENEVTEALRAASDDPVTLRRELYDAGLLDRDADGSRYRRRS